MRAIMILFDSLKRDWLPCYGGDIDAPNFARLAEHTAVFDNFYIGSMPCMPARRELHTGRYNFLHRGWGPLEPFDDSMPELLRDAGIHSHLVSDHHHYWREGGANYHGRYSTYEHIRGQEGDFWKGEPGAEVPNVSMAEELPPFFRRMYVQDGVNRKYMQREADHPQSRTFEAGLEFIDTNRAVDDWFLQIECFDPHEPFFTYEQYREKYPSRYQGRHIDWPSPGPADQDEDYIEYVQNQYKALVTQIDGNLGKVLDRMDSYDLWKDTMLIVNTDHGLLLGEHDWWSKGAMPPYNEIARLPFFLWDPRCGIRGERRSALAQNIDVPATLLEFFSRPLPPDMQGKPLGDTVRNDTPVHESILFGYFGGSVNVTDGRRLYMRGPVSPQNLPLYEYTLAPARMGSRIDVGELKGMELHAPFGFTKDCATLKIPARQDNVFSNPYRYGSRLYDLEKDPGQKQPLEDIESEYMLVQEMIRLMKETEAPPEQYERMGLRPGMTREDLRAQRKAFREQAKPPVLARLPWEKAAVQQFQTMAALLRDPELGGRFEVYARRERLAEITAKDIERFAAFILKKEQAGGILMMLRLAGRTD